MKKLLLVAIVAFVAVGLAMGCAPTAQKDAAKKMISDAKAAGAKNNANAKARLDSAESSYAAGEKADKKMKYKDSKAAYEKAYREAKDAWKMAVKRQEPCSTTCPAGYKPCP
jgi:CRISPR/Cas system CMR subunit Cmr6 (Cas7 group RAMP superfamily)